MKKIMITGFVLGLFVYTYASQLVTVQTTNDAHNAIVLINHIGWEVSRIMAMRDRPSLEAEYEMISIDQLDLETIKDEGIADQIRALSTYITQRRIEAGEREMLEHEYEYNRDNALYSAFPSPSAIVAADWGAIAYNLVQSTISSYMAYRKSVASLKIRLERDKWELEKGMISDLDQLYQFLFDKQQKLIQQYQLDDYWRVSPKQAQLLVSYIEDVDVNERYEDVFEFMDHTVQRQTFQKLPVYWYYLGVVAEKVGRKDVAMEAYDRYQREYCQILRFDRTAASVAMNKANLLLEQSAAPDLVRKQLAIIEHNKSDDWTFMYYCASVYYELEDEENARRTLDQATIILRHDFDSALQRTERLSASNELEVTEHILPNAMPMIACQMLRLKLDGEIENRDSVRKALEEARRNWGRNCFGILSFDRQIPFDEIANCLKPCFKGVCMEYQYDSSMFGNPAPYRFVLSLPLELLFAGHVDVSAVVKFDDGSRDVTLGLHPRYDGANPRVTADRTVQYILDCPSEIVRHRSPLQIELLLKHKLYPVTVVLDATPLKKVRETHEKCIRLNLIDGHYKNKVFPLR